MIRKIMKGLIAMLILLPLSTGFSADTKYELAIFAGGCFWCMVPPFEKLNGVKEVISGYTGGHTKNPTYEDVETGGTGHVEAIEVIYDPSVITYNRNSSRCSGPRSTRPTPTASS